jgi:hypothetical protein
MDAGEALDVAIIGRGDGRLRRLPVAQRPAARIFMGDTGSLALGGLLAAVAVATNTQFLLVLLGGLFVVETLSVIVQVAVFRTTGKRVLRMAPLHHHFELLGWQETTIIVRFWIIAGIGVALGLGVFYAEYLSRAPPGTTSSSTGPPSRCSTRSTWSCPRPGSPNGPRCWPRRPPLACRSGPSPSSAGGCTPDGSWP